MSFYQDVRDEILDVTLILTIPRTVSTALMRSLGNSPSVHGVIAQPHSVIGKNGYIDPIGYIDHHVRDLKKKHKPTPDDPLHIVVKEMAGDISYQRFVHWKRHCKNIILLCRDPHLQSLSHIHVFNKQAGVFPTSVHDLSVERFSSKDADHFFGTPWLYLENLACGLYDDEAPNVVVMDGDLLRTIPIGALRILCENIGIEYSDSMVSEWTDAPATIEDLDNQFGVEYVSCHEYTALETTNARYAGFV